MRRIQSIELNEANKEELLPGFDPDFPYIATCAELDKYIDPVVPWHWHKTVELFYMKSGILEYTTPNGKWTIPAGCGGFVNSNVLHTSQIKPSDNSTIQYLHLFDPVFLSGEHGSRIEEKYIHPLTASTSVEMIALYPDHPDHAEILLDIQRAFEISENEWGYEFELRRQLAAIWLKLFEIARPAMMSNHRNIGTDNKVKLMMKYIHDHYPENISVDQLAREAHISKRVCFRLFRENLHMSPVEYMTSYRLRKACQRLAESDESITQIAYNCGLGSSSYFGKLFREHFGCSPAAYRKEWHNRDKNTHK